MFKPRIAAIPSLAFRASDLVILPIYPRALLSLKIGSSSAMPIEPTTPPITVIISGSIMLVTDLSETSTSLS